MASRIYLKKRNKVEKKYRQKTLSKVTRNSNKNRQALDPRNIA